ncbi:MAG: DMT family transporter [Proteobacteria bacterium]|nr:DMT family transporter [Pseudomonadota bacterium]MDA1308894.1 DMT family transporter [Pseudomonadota bacterium]
MTGFILLGVTALFFGAAPTFAKLAFDGGIDALSLQVFRFAITFAAVLLMVLVNRHLPRIKRRQLPRLLLLAICTAVSSFCYMTAVRHVSVAVASLTFFTFPLVVGLLSHFLGTDRLGWRKSLAIVVAFTGLCLVLGGDLELNWRGVSLAFIAGSTVAASFVLSRPLTRELPSLTITAFATGVPCILYLIVGMTTAALTFPDTTAGMIGVLGNALCYAIGLVCLYGSIARLGALRTAILINAEPLVSVAAAFLILGQTIGLLQMAGALIVILGIFLITMDPESKSAARSTAKQSD